MMDRRAGRADSPTTDGGPLRVHFDRSCGPTLRAILIEARSQFVETSPALADLVIFGTDEIGYIDHSALYRSHRSKSICITESDIPTFRLPGLYAANERSYVTSRRIQTISYFVSERERGNPEVRRLLGQKVEKRYLYSFMGGSNCWARKRLFRHVHSRDDTLIEPTDSYNHWFPEKNDLAARENQMRRYAEVMAASRFALCPRGCGLSSYRLFESMSLGVAPVIISDKWRPIEGIDWSFAIFIRERDIPRVDQIVRSHEGEWEARGQAGQSVYQNMLSRDVVAEMVHDRMIRVARSFSPAREAVMAPITRARTLRREAYWVIYGWLKRIALWGFYVTGQPVPIRLNRPLEVQLNMGLPARLGRSDS